MLTEKLRELEREYRNVERELADPEVFGNTQAYLKLNRRYAELGPIMTLWQEYQAHSAAAQEARELLEDPEMRDLAVSDLEASEERLRAIEAELDVLLLPSDPRDSRNVILELRAGAGGDEAALFAADLLRMYQRYAETAGLRLEVLEASESDLGGFSKVVAELSGDYVYRRFKFEGGVHRVQRVPATESQGRIHTSTVTVAVVPEAEESEFELDLSQVRIDVFRSQGAGGQGVNTTDSAVRAVYKPGTPEELIVVCQDSRSQIKNREKALLVLRSRLAEQKQREEEAEQRASRQAMIGSGDRSEKIRTYNYPQNRVTDHRLTGENKNFPLDTVIDGQMGPLLEALQAMEREQLLEAMAEQEGS
ncbi:peptide chain release factor 1 [Deinobacterium chartae]|uniref:Peptide chain release factor 1 n=1 Tax=Deinobacterium chartae TaxID=521158 RepID=A0A841HXJ8_9DEIO|nr:peptide chain release factor 1 [Deinobacterium chartae]